MPCSPPSTRRSRWRELTDRNAEALADLIEVGLLADPSAGVSAADVRVMLHEVAGADDATADMTLNAMERRQRLLGDHYPFRVSAVGVRRAPEVDRSKPYETLLLLARKEAPYRGNPGALQDAAIVFEELTVVAVRALLGSSSRALRFAWPSAEGRPREFSAAVAWLAERMGLPLGAAYRPPRRQDGGVDVVAWRPFGDEQPGFPVLLVQCTLEQDYVHKSEDIDLRVWSGWLSFDTDPMTALAIPGTVARAEDWRTMAARVLVLDRLRLATLVGGQSSDAAVDQWREEQVALLRGAAG